MPVPHPKEFRDDVIAVARRGEAPIAQLAQDADLEVAVEGAMLAKMRNIGEACTAANRFFVHESVAEDFSRRFAERMGGLTVGKGTAKGTDVGPLITQQARYGVGGVKHSGYGREGGFEGNLETKYIGIAL